MATPRVTPVRNSDGSIASYEQRKRMRQAADRERRAVERQVAQEAKREAELNPPPKPLPFHERQALRKAEDQGRKDAADKAAAEAAEAATIAGPVNPYRLRYQEIESHFWHNASQKQSRLQHFNALADAWDQEQAAISAAAEHQVAIDNDPQVKTARDYVAGLVKLAPDEFKTEAAEIQGIALAGDSQLAWSRMRDLESRIWKHQDRIAAEKRASKAATDAEFIDAATQAEESRERFEHAQEMAGE
ncbi:MAG: hypothetical protein K2Y37_06670 [Pirellulales bacterium]|nr:hypothetical protein [Pirellulales bacterium]